ncbi:MAG: tRNA (guanosine(37)-N1)-methyltransferase TrmD [Candidatus Nomurabacteria bacterium]|jgi:tRNA (guanine37-N1)-methyltransferase|nr:tRNA (guanosine(37)-N1)-methyltransferase TrmD [Candidatus Nomurabacteria bacterium]
MKKFVVITLLPDAVRAYLDSSMLWKAQKDNLARFDVINLRDFGRGAHQSVDDTPYGGGDGMLLKVDVLADAVAAAKKILPDGKVLLMTPCENLWNQAKAQQLADSDDDFILLCGRYEGFDARVDSLVDQKISIGQYVLTGGELPALSVIDSIVRLIPGVLGGASSAAIESYTDGANLEFPQYTRPEIWNGLKVPEILLSGDHQAVENWRRENSK